MVSVADCRLNSLYCLLLQYLSISSREIFPENFINGEIFPIAAGNPLVLWSPYPCLALQVFPLVTWHVTLGYI
jgi:hypothetical protein